MKKLNSLKNNQSLVASVIIVFLAAVMRLLPHPANIAPITALALFGGSHFKGARVFIIPLLAMFLSDVFLGFHSTIPYVYGSFLLIVLIGKLLEKKQTFTRILGASITSSLFFFFITNFGVWATGTMYTKDMSGLMTSYLMGIPFLRNTFIGDLLYTFAFFYGYQYVVAITKKFLPVIATTKRKSS